MPDEREKHRSRFSEGLENAAITGAAAETVRRYGSAVKEHLVAYSGMDNEAGVKLTRGLKSVSESKINPDFAENNIKQQAGFSAEIKSAARGNAENIINKKPARIRRTDDLGSVNDQIRDLVEVGPDGGHHPRIRRPDEICRKRSKSASRETHKPQVSEVPRRERQARRCG